MDTMSYLLGKNASGGGGGGSDLDWTALGYASTPQDIVDDYNYSKQIMDNWSPSINIEYKYGSNNNLVYMPLVDTSIVIVFRGVFNQCANLRAIPLLDTSNTTTFENCFAGCTNLEVLPQLNTSKVTNFSGMFSSYGSRHLSDESLNNVLKMCINATSYSGTKTLVQLGITSASHTASKIQGLSSYQAFLDAGWTIGY